MSRIWTQHNIALPRLISVRKQEKLESVKAKRRDDLQVIADRRKCKEKLEPFPDGAFERLQRDQIWEEVLQYITDPSDMTSAYYACRTFADILEERRKLMLLPKALKVLLEGDETRHVDGLLGKLNLLGLRGASKALKKIADYEIFEASLTGESWYTQVEGMSDCHDCDVDVCILHNKKSVDHALTLPIPPNENGAGAKSSIVRKLYVDRSKIRPGPAMDSFKNSVLQFLDKHGSSIWLFALEGDYSFSNYNLCWEMLQKMPNLKACILRKVTRPSVECLDFEISMFTLIMETMRPFPVLNSLEYLHLGDEANEHLVEHLYERCVNLKSVVQYDSFVNKKVRTSLKKFPLERFFGPVKAITPRSFSATWQLKVLEIHGAEQSLKRSTLWPALNRFQQTLQELTIGFDVRKDDPWIPLNLPLLKFLKLGEISRGSVGFDDLLQLKSLEKLILLNYLKDVRPQDKNALVKVFGIRENMEKSNIWACFPYLKQLLFKHCCLLYVRHGSTLSQYEISDDSDEEEEEWKLQRISQICNE